MPEARINGARIHYERAGAGLPLMFLHAGIADSRMWEPQVHEFAKHFDVICPDTRGFGRSEMPPGRWSPVGDLLALIDQLHEKPVHLVGCSMGGGIAIDFALQHGQRISRLVLVGSALGGYEFRPEHANLFTEAAAAHKATDYDALNVAMMHLFLDGPNRPRGHVTQPIRELFLDMNARAVRRDVEASPADKLDPPAIERLSEITAPTLVVVGDEDVPDVLEVAEILVNNVAHVHKAVIHDAAHLPNLEHPDEFNRIVLEFLQGS